MGLTVTGIIPGYENGQETIEFYELTDSNSNTVNIVDKVVYEDYLYRGLIDNQDIPANTLPIRDRNSMQSKMSYKCLTGKELLKYCEAYTKWEHRDLYDEVIKQAQPGCIKMLLGIRRTGKTVLLLQSAYTMEKENPNSTILILIYNQGCSMSNIYSELEIYQSRGISNAFIDEISITSDFLYNSKALADLYSLRINLTIAGTDSARLVLSTYDMLYDRTLILNTTYISYGEYHRITGRSFDIYLKMGGLLGPSSEHFDISKSQKYFDAAITDNISRAIAVMENPGFLSNISRTSILQRLLNCMLQNVANITIINGFHQLESAFQIYNKSAEQTLKLNLLSDIDLLEYYTGLYDDNDNIINEILGTHKKEAEKTLIGILEDLDVLYWAGSDEYTGTHLLTVPAINYYLMLETLRFIDKQHLTGFSDPEHNKLRSIIINDTEGCLIENICMLNIHKLFGRKYRVFKYNYMGQEFDIVVYDYNNKIIHLYEVKRTNKQTVEYQCKWLCNEQSLNFLCNYLNITENSCTTYRNVLYQGVSDVVIYNSHKVYYINIEEFLLDLYKNRTLKPPSQIDHIVF